MGLLNPACDGQSSGFPRVPCRDPDGTPLAGTVGSARVSLERDLIGVTPLRQSKESDLDLATEVLAYFVRNPRAADSAEGIARWRVMDEKVCRNVRETYAVLRWLVAHGYLEETSSRSAGAIFRLNEDRAAEARSFVEAAASPRRRRARGAS